MICSNCESTGFTCGGCGVNLEPEDAYTAAEVKILTEDACKVAAEAGRRIGWREAVDYVAESFETARPLPGWGVFSRQPDRVMAARMTRLYGRNLSLQPQNAASDATSGVPRHPEVSEAPKAPQEPCGRPECYGALMHTHPTKGDG